MKPLLVLRDEDIFPNEKIPENIEYQLREAVRIILFDENKKIALVGKKYRILPGGGVEEGETLEEAARRETLEEVGCDIEIEREFAMTEEFRAHDERRQETHFFLAHLVGEKCEPKTTQADEQGIQVGWYNLNDAAVLLEKEIIEISPQSYHSCFNVRTHTAVLKELQKISK